MPVFGEGILGRLNHVNIASQYTMTQTGYGRGEDGGERRHGCLVVLNSAVHELNTNLRILLMCIMKKS